MSQPVISLDVNTGSQASPSWSNVVLPQVGTGVESRWSDAGNQTGVGSGSWPAAANPTSGTRAATSFYLYRFSADTVGLGVPGGAAPLVFANSNYLMCRWSIAAGTFNFASAPILTAYNDSQHGGPTLRAATAKPPFPNRLSGSITDTGTVARSYLKANAYGVFGSVPAAVSSLTPIGQRGPRFKFPPVPSQVPLTAPPIIVAAPTNAPVVTDGTTGSVSPAATPAWLSNWQSLCADLDFITCASIPAANTAAVWYFMLAIFAGANLAVGTYTTLISLRYAWN